MQLFTVLKLTLWLRFAVQPTTRMWFCKLRSDYYDFLYKVGFFSIFQIDEVDAEKLHTLKYSSGGVLSNKSAQTQQTKIENNLETKQSPPACNTLNPSDLPFIDEDERELDEAIRDAIGLAQDEVVASIQLGSTASPGTYSTASTLLLSERSCSGTDTIHMSEKVIKRDYRDL